MHGWRYINQWVTCLQDWQMSKSDLNGRRQGAPGLQPQVCTRPITWGASGRAAKGQLSTSAGPLWHLRAKP